MALPESLNAKSVGPGEALTAGAGLMPGVTPLAATDAPSLAPVVVAAEPARMARPIPKP